MFDLILIDFSWLYNKYYYVAKYVRGEESEKTDLKTTVFNMLLRFLSLAESNYGLSKFLLVLDPPTSNLKNSLICSEYKQNRNKEEKKEVYSIFKDVVKELNRSLGKNFSFVRALEFEADQVIAFLAQKYSTDKQILVFSGDKDLLQLTALNNIYVSDKYEKGKFLIKSDKEIFSKFKNSKGEDFTRISSNKKDILKYRVLKGDVSDNLSSVFPRIKDKEIASIIKDYWVGEEELTEQIIDKVLEDLEHDNLVLAGKLRENRNIWIRNYKLMNLYNLEDIRVKKVKR